MFSVPLRQEEQKIGDFSVDKASSVDDFIKNLEVE